MRLTNPVRSVAVWLGWSEDDFYDALGRAATAAAFGAAVYLSYNSLLTLAFALGYETWEAPAFPLCLDALAAACYVAQARLAGLPGFATHRTYLVVLGIVAAALTGCGNALHGVLTWHLLSTPLPWPLLVAGSMIPPAAMAGAAHALSIQRSAGRERKRRQGVMPRQGGSPPPPLAESEPAKGGKGGSLEMADVAAAEAAIRGRGDRVTNKALAVELGVSERTLYRTKPANGSANGRHTTEVS
jgi:hypothetical protein